MITRNTKTKTIIFDFAGIDLAPEETHTAGDNIDEIRTAHIVGLPAIACT